MKNLIILMLFIIAFSACDKHVIQPIGTNQPSSVSHDSIIARINNGDYIQYNTAYERAAKGKVLLIHNSEVVDSTSNQDSIYCYFSFNIELNYNYCQQQLINDIANGTSGYIPYVDTPTHLVFNSSKCWISTGSPGTHLVTFDHRIENPVMTLNFKGTQGFMESNAPIKLRVGDKKSNVYQQSYEIWGSQQLARIRSNWDSNSFIISAVNVNRGGYFYGMAWEDNLY
jgi:hypothetical protein